MYLLELTRPPWKYSFHFNNFENFELSTSGIYFPLVLNLLIQETPLKIMSLKSHRTIASTNLQMMRLTIKKHFAHCSQLFNCYLPIQLHITDYMNISWGVSIKKEWNAILWVAKSKCLTMNAVIYPENVCRTGRDTRLNI